MSEDNRYNAVDQQQQLGAGDGRANNPSTAISSGNSNIVVPTAPYPPMNNYYGMQSAPSKSALSSSPHYTTTYGRASMPPSLVGGHVTTAPASGLLPYGTGAAIGGNFSATSNHNNNYDSGLLSSSKLYNQNISGSANNINAGSGVNASSTSPGVSHPSQIMFCPGRHDIIASINCVSSSSKNRTKANRQQASHGGNINNSIHGKLGGPATASENGPIMLELRRLELATKDCDSNSDCDDTSSDGVDTESSFFTTQSVAVSRGNPNLGITSVVSTCMDLPSLSVVQNYDSSSAMVAVTGSSSGALCIHRFNDIDEVGDDSNEGMFSSSAIEYFHMPRHHRKASSVAWRPAIHKNHVAIGLVAANATAVGNLNNPIPRRGGNIKMRSGGSDREYCCFLWDIVDTKKTMPLSKFAFNSPVASLAWMMDGQTLAVGSQQRTIQLYDLRLSTNNDNKLPPLSAHAHESAVDGIEVHPHRPHLMATFCRSVGEPVKLFDIRRMDSVVSEIRLVSNSDSHNIGGSTASIPKSFSAQRMQQAKVEAVQWSLIEPGLLSVASGESIQEYDTNSGSRPSLVRTNRISTAGKFIKAIALYRGKEVLESPTAAVSSNDNDIESYADGSMTEEKNHAGDDAHPTNNDKSDRLLSLLYPKRLLVVLEDQTIEDMAKDTNAPLAISRRDGRIVHALGPQLFICSSSEGASAMERIVKRDEEEQAQEEEDISATMMRRARCLQTNPYSMNPERNIKLMSQEVASEDVYQQLDKPLASMLPGYSNRALLRLWGWIERVESLSFQDVDDTDDDPRMIRDILNAGVLQLLNFQRDDVNKEQIMYSETLSWNVYDSPARRASLSSCGWAGKFDLTIVMAECEALGEYERSAALAVWHEDMGSAVEALQRASEAIHLQVLEGENRSSLSASTRYAETLGLISMCIAGFGGKTESQRGVWTRACANLLARDDMSSAEGENSTRVAYLRAVCEFLMNAGTNESLLKVLENTNLSLCDRVAFACRFLDRKELTTYLLRCVKICQQCGDLEGLAITGLSKPGIKILQSFVDHHTDIQTAALVVSRVILPTDWASERKICFEWVESYRSLLNVWQMWQSRAMFDVDRADLLRRVKARNGGAGYQRRIPNPRVRQSPRPPDPDILPHVPAQLEARCNYCNSPLSLKKQEGATNQWLSKMQPLLNCCPQCRKPLPRCSVCLLPMGSLNPYMELTRARQGPRGSGKNISSPDDLSSLSSMNFASWYTWCMR